MPEHHQLAERLARLRQDTGGSSPSELQARLNMLSEGRVPEEGAENDFNRRLTSFVSEREGKSSSSADDLNARLAGLSTSSGVDVAAARDMQTYDVPEVRGWQILQASYSQRTLHRTHAHQ